MTQLNVVLPALHPGQREVAEHPARFKVLVAGRRWRKTSLGVQLCLVTALRGGRTWWVAPSYPLTQVGWRFLKHLIRQIPGAGIREGDKIVTVPGGGEVQVKSADNPDSLRGAGLDGVVIDEAAYVQEEAWTEALRPALADRLGWALFISTPHGENWFHKLFERAATLADWARWQFPSWTNPALDAEELATARTELGEAIFNQEFGAAFLDISTLKLFRGEWILYWEERPKLETLFTVVGVDPAISKRDEACETAIVIAGQPLHGINRTTAHVLQAASGHWSPYETASKLLAVVKEFKPRKLRIEKVAWQAALADIVQREAQLAGIRLPMIDLAPPDGDKIRRASRWAPLVEGGHVLFGPGQKHLIDALLAVPERTSAWDLVDAAGLAITGLPHPHAERSRLKGTEEPDAPRRRAKSYAIQTVPDAAPLKAPITSTGPTARWRAPRRPTDYKRRARSYAVRA